MVTLAKPKVTRETELWIDRNRLEHFKRLRNRLEMLYKGRSLLIIVENDPADAARFVARGWDIRTRQRLFTVRGRRRQDLPRFLDMTAKVSSRAAHLRVQLELDPAPAGTTPYQPPHTNPGGGQGSQPQPGDPNPKGFVSLPEDVLVGSTFTFTAWETNTSPWTMNEVKIFVGVHALNPRDAAGVSPPALKLTVPPPSSGYTALSASPATFGVPLAPDTRVTEMYLIRTATTERTLDPEHTLSLTLANCVAELSGNVQLKWGLSSFEFEQVNAFSSIIRVP